MLVAKALQAQQVAKEINRLAKRGLRFLPSTKLDATTRTLVNAWQKKLGGSAVASENLLIAGLEKAERGIHSIKEFNTLKASILNSRQVGNPALPGLYTRSTHFNTEVAGEILKLAFSLNKSWSFAVHILLLYGLEAMAEQIATQGALLPTKVASPSKELAEGQTKAGREAIQAERDAAFKARNPDFDPDNRIKPYFPEQNLDI